jgi:S-DNA-T family DNA segregation ATPase FtsK/SpoIIIE
MLRNTYKENTYRQEETPKPTKKPQARLKLLKDRRVQLIAGFFLLFFSFYLLISLVSYLATAKADQSLVEAYQATGVLEAGEEVENWLGAYGAICAYYLVYKWLGLGAFFLIPIGFALGWRVVFRSKLFNLERFSYFAAFFTLWLSILLGYVASNMSEGHQLGLVVGALGFEIALFAKALLGWGTALFIIFLLVAFIIYFFDITTIHSPKLQPWQQQAPETKEAPPVESIKEKKTTPPLVVQEQEEVEEIEEESENPAELLASEDDIDEELKKMGIKLINARTKEEIKPEKEKPAQNEKIALSKEEEAHIELPLTPSHKESKSIELALEENKPLKILLKEAPSLDLEIEVKENLPQNPHQEALEEEEEELLPQKKAEEVLANTNFDPTLDLSDYIFPPLSLLNEPPEDKVQVSREELEANKDKIVETLGYYGINIASIKATIGPTVTLYEIVPDAGIRISKIKNLEDDIALSLAALGIRIIAPIPGKGTIGIEVPNKRREMVAMRSVLGSEKFTKAAMELPVVFGKTVTNDIFVVDLAKMPHLLMAGATGQGKSVGLNVILASLIYRKHPSELKFVLVDPKKVELTLFSQIEKHFLAKLPNEEEAIITDTSKVINTLNSLCIEMDSRYDLLKAASCRNIKEYNHKFTERRLNPLKGHRFLPYIVLVIDELADLMMTAGKEVEQPIARLAQLARAIGIHLVVATQRPSVNVITGIIKANFPARLSFRVTSKIDSRTILDTGGAEQLIGMGDMLYSTGSDLTRLQCAFIDTPEVERVCAFIAEQRSYPSAYHLPEYVGDSDAADNRGDLDLSDRDELFEEAARIIVMHQQGSTSLLQRRLKLGYNRAGRLIDQLEKAGIVGAFEGSKAREVLVPDEFALEKLLNDLKS